SVAPKIRETVEAVRRLVAAKKGQPVTGKAVAEALGLDKSAASRRISEAIDAGYLRNLEWSEGRPSQLVLGESLPEEHEVLPTVEALTAELERCTVAAVAGEEAGPPAPVEEVAFV
ncbi:MAG TPA: helix-turn-helix domain-containing protein, partial [Dehalococcoidia bacterium]|nr:helix-turn-helix domain-containing protein [Dehalococcoidia bacterium]